MRNAYQQIQKLITVNKDASTSNSISGLHSLLVFMDNRLVNGFLENSNYRTPLDEEKRSPLVLFRADYKGAVSGNEFMLDADTDAFKLFGNAGAHFMVMKGEWEVISPDGSHATVLTHGEFYDLADYSRIRAHITREKTNFLAILLFLPKEMPERPKPPAAPQETL